MIINLLAELLLCFDKHPAGVRRFWRITYIITFGPHYDYDILTHSVSWY